jgi:hypothetical protein
VVTRGESQSHDASTAADVVVGTWLVVVAWVVVGADAPVVETAPMVVSVAVASVVDASPESDELHAATIIAAAENIATVARRFRGTIFPLFLLGYDSRPIGAVSIIGRSSEISPSDVGVNR